MADYYPLMLKLDDARVLVVGGGPVAERKIDSLLESGAKISAVAPKFTVGIKELAAGEENLKLSQREYEKGELREFKLVFLACGEPEVKKTVLADAAEAGVLVNTVDSPQECDFIVPATVRRGDLILAVSTSGRCPALSKKVRRELEEKYPAEYADYLAALGRLRDKIKQEIKDVAVRRRVLEKLVNSSILKDYISGEISDIKQTLNDIYELIRE